LGGLMAHIADEAGIHYRVLNRRKGPAVRGPRAQMDRDLYREAMQSTLRDYPNLSLIQASVQDILLDESTTTTFDSSFSAEQKSSLSSATGLLGLNRSDKAQNEQLIQSTMAKGADRHARIRGIVVERDDQSRHEIYGSAVVVTTGTFLRGVLMQGHNRYAVVVILMIRKKLKVLALDWPRHWNASSFH
jgi:tRNA U34 5-carboxymethylaminomethyl modifying enzyme MnmG/GidA